MGVVLIVYLVIMAIATGGHFRRAVAAAKHEKDLQASMTRLVEKNEEAKRLADKYRIAADIAEKASRAKSTFLGNMSHELRTPLNGVIGLMTLAFKSDVAEKRREYQQAALKSADALVAILDDVLALTEADAGMLEFDRHNFDIRDTIDTAMALFRAEADRKELKFSVAYAPDAPTVIESDGPADPPDSRQSDRQRREIHGNRRRDRARRRRPRPARTACLARSGGGYGRRRRAGRRSAHLRAFHAGRRIANAPVWRRWAGVGRLTPAHYSHGRANLARRFKIGRQRFRV